MVDGETGHLNAGDAGATITWHETGPGDKIAKVNVGASPPAAGTFARITADGSGPGLYTGVGLGGSPVYGLGEGEVGELREAQQTSGVEANTLVEVQTSLQEEGADRHLFTFTRALPPGGQPGEVISIGTNGRLFWTLPFFIGPGS